MYTLVTKIYSLLGILLVIFFESCDGNLIAESEPELVVEGWIENDKNPIVMVSSTIPLQGDFQYADDLGAYTIKSAEVTVSNGEREVLLKGTKSSSYPSSFIYTTTDMVGEIGKNYKLTVNYKQYHAEATTNIVNLPCVDTLLVEPSEGKDTLYQVKAFLRDTEEKGNYYKIFTMIHPGDTYYLSYVGSTFRDKILNLHKEGISVFPGHNFSEEDYQSDFTLHDSLYVKIAQIDEDGYAYWYDFEDMFVTVSNPIFPIRFNVRSNIKGGKGYWCGYAAIEKLIVFADYR